MVKKKKNQEEILEDDYLDKPEEVPEVDEEELAEEEPEDDISTLRQDLNAVIERIDKLQKGVVVNQKYITQHHEDISKLKEDFKLVLEGE